MVKPMKLRNLFVGIVQSQVISMTNVWLREKCFAMGVVHQTHINQVAQNAISSQKTVTPSRRANRLLQNPTNFKIQSMSNRSYREQLRICKHQYEFKQFCHSTTLETLPHKTKGVQLDKK